MHASPDQTAAFYARVTSFAAPADARAELERLIWQEYGVEKAVLALDMSHFSLYVRRNGILAYLGMIREMQVLATPIIAQHGGQVVKCEADNLMALFDSPVEAVRAAVAINRQLAEQATGAIDHSLEVGIGIDLGRILWIRDCDCFGDSVNLAYKLGEDLAQSGEVLVTDRVREAAGEALAYPLSELRMSISGLEFTVYRVDYSATRSA